MNPDAPAGCRGNRGEMPERLITIATFSQAIEAHLCKTRLETEGIACFIADENIVTMNWLYSTAVGGIKLQVKEADAEKARKILQQENITPETINKTRKEKFYCPRCHSPHVFYERFSRRLVFASWLLLGIPFLKKKWKCENCGHQWELKEIKK